MFEKLENSWKLAKQCWRVLLLDKEMLMFPLLSMVTSVIALLVVAYPLWQLGYLEFSEPIEVNLSQGALTWGFVKILIITFIFSYVGYLIMTFFNAGLITCAFIRLCGDNPVLSDGLRVACKRLPQILAWSVIAATIGLLLRMIKGKNSTGRSILSGFLGFGWRIATFFVVPVIVAEEKGAIDATKRSASLVKKNWGEAISLEMGFSMLAGIVMIAPAGLIGLSTMVSATSPMLAFLLIGIAAIAAFLISLLFSTLDAIAKAALYMYASGDQMPEGFEREVLENTFKQTNAGKPVSA